MFCLSGVHTQMGILWCFYGSAPGNQVTFLVLQLWWRFSAVGLLFLENGFVLLFGADSALLFPRVIYTPIFLPGFCAVFCQIGWMAPSLGPVSALFNSSLSLYTRISPLVFISAQLSTPNWGTGLLASGPVCAYFFPLFCKERRGEERNRGCV